MKRLATVTVKRWLRILLHTQDSPQRTSFAFALGVFIAFLPPVPWFHTLFALLIAFYFRMNRLAIILGTYVNSPLTIFPLLAAEMSVGLAIVGGKDAPEVSWRQLRHWQGWKNAFIELRPFLGPLMVGSILLGLIASVIAYFVALKLILVYRHRMARAALAAQAELELPSPNPRTEPSGQGPAPARSPAARPAVDSSENPT